MMKRIWFALIMLLPMLAIAQEQAVPFGTGPNGIIRCATVENMAQLRAQYPQMQTEEEFENWIQEKIVEAERNGTAHSRMVLTIPVIVHVIHNGENVGVGTNISQAQINSQIEVLNEDYRRMLGTAGYNTDSVGADTEIEFCLAYRDPMGQVLAEAGIERIDRNSRSWPSQPYNMTTMSGTIKPATFWDPEKYFNVWVTNISGSVLGYAQGPNGGFVSGWGNNVGGASTDGVVIGYRYFGRVGNVAAPYNRGRTLTHEAGHWLGLHHLWAPSNGSGSCSTDDFCADTPNSDDANYGCATTHVSCGTPDMVRNYMDYSDDACMNIFTQCQKTRMRTVLMNAPRRAGLITSMVCGQPTAAPVANFGVIDNNACTGLVSFQDSSSEFPNQWYWVFGDGNTSTVANPTHVYTTSGTYTVTLATTNSFGTTNTSRQITINVSPAASVDAGPDLVACAGGSYTLNVNVSDPTATVRWSPSFGLLNPTSRNPIFQAINGNTFFVTATDSTGCQATDTLMISVVPKPLLNAGNDITIQPGNTANLSASLSKTPRSWRWTPIYGFMTTGHDTLRNPVVQPAQTVTYTVTATDLDGCVVTDNIKVTVEGTNPLSIGQSFESDFGLISLPYPNPAQREVVFMADFTQSADLHLELYDLSGRRITTIFQGKVGQGGFTQKWQRDTQVSDGLYFVIWRIEGKQLVQKIQLN